jgi:hypothetical protein
MENLDLREILKDVPRGTKLYSTIHGNIHFDGVSCNNEPYPINCHGVHDFGLAFTKEGKWHHYSINADVWKKFSEFISVIGKGK